MVSNDPKAIQQPVKKNIYIYINNNNNNDCMHKAKVLEISQLQDSNQYLNFNALDTHTLLKQEVGRRYVWLVPVDKVHNCCPSIHTNNKRRQWFK